MTKKKIKKSNIIKVGFDKQKEEWSRLPVDDRGYFSAKSLLKKSDYDLTAIVRYIEYVRYAPDRWRNWENRWREYLGLDSTRNKRIIDYGCGIGVEALQFAKKGNEAVIADINKDSVDLAERVLNLYDYFPEKHLISGKYPFIDNIDPVDIFYCNGVLHHIPYPKKVLKRARELLKDDGEIRLMLYSDRGWKKYVGGQIPNYDEDVSKHPDFMKFVRRFDRVGFYADFYNKKKIEYKFGDFLRIKLFKYITNDDRYLVAILKKR